MALYSANNQTGGTPQPTAATFKTQTNISAATATLRRAAVYEFEFGAAAVPNATDCEIYWDMSRQTSLGTGTTSVANPLDPADAATGMVATSAFTAEPTTTANQSLWSMPANQRGSFRWQVNPGGPGELIIPATNLNGLGLRAKSSTYIGVLGCSIYYRE